MPLQEWKHRTISHRNAFDLLSESFPNSNEKWWQCKTEQCLVTYSLTTQLHRSETSHMNQWAHLDLKQILTIKPQEQTDAVLWKLLAKSIYFRRWTKKNIKSERIVSYTNQSWAKRKRQLLQGSKQPFYCTRKLCGMENRLTLQMDSMVTCIPTILSTRQPKRVRENEDNSKRWKKKKKWNAKRSRWSFESKNWQMRTAQLMPVSCLIAVSVTEKEIEYYTDKQLEILLKKRHIRKIQHSAAVVIQKHARGMITREKFKQIVRTWPRLLRETGLQW
jgi:hypothetical protein